MREVEMTADVCVVIPAYNAAKYIAETLNSVLGQSLPPREIIVVDDGSTDNTSEVVSAISNKVKLIRTSNRGVSHARNVGFEETQCKWVAFLDSDDIWNLNKIERIMHYSELNPGSHLFFSDFVTFGLQSKVVELGDSFRKWQERRNLLLSPIVCVLPSAAVVSRETLARFPEWAGNDNEDTIYFNDVAENGRVIHVPEVLVRYRKHPTSAQKKTGSGERAGVNMLKRYTVNSKDKRLFLETLFELIRERRSSRRWNDFDIWSQLILDNWTGDFATAMRFYWLRISKQIVLIKDRLFP
jgi:glycosyltransferase involved in cell wall biosynthesis